MQRVPHLNLALKTAILASGKLQKQIAREAAIDETTLSHIVRGRLAATTAERRRLARVLAKSEAELFPELTSPDQCSAAS